MPICLLGTRSVSVLHFYNATFFLLCSFNSFQSDEEEMEPPEDLSSMVKVEMEEGPAIDSATTGSEHQTPTPTPSPPPAPSHLIPPALKRFPPLPQVQVDQFPPRIPGQELPNMFHFGDVAVGHHPDTPPVPMVIPMVYLYPLPSQDHGNGYFI